MEPRKYHCSHCDATVAPDVGYSCELDSGIDGVQLGKIYICPNCNRPTYFELKNGWIQIPSPRYGNHMEHLPKEIEQVYIEIRDCMSHKLYTAGVLLARKLLMNIAVDSGAKEGEGFVVYVDYLQNEGIIPKKGKGWVDAIRKAGNIATHKIPSIDQKLAEEIVTFLEFLLRITYEMPGKMAKT
ncbi:DUF4145 domain-containing protein [Bacillus safensis]|uniref:DUF4145 domain-containing protein n=1 Tax=Bacillus safensis TaxID=561879 RepID=UPI000B436EA1|nr:DUF4145 domain-containing protein [Bacillus safensis]MCR6473145.1 DUF4145 domain-containing protein [Bacillus safensis]MCY7493397.1 DUF4145 domain-containing protein [Bacillus safensis]MED4992200.1 DUF4145 domain-containing protein [Bacillus safensis]UDB47800.1 DUF4145 domain-containing protein [Bacillus safensis]